MAPDSVTSLALLADLSWRRRIVRCSPRRVTRHVWLLRASHALLVDLSIRMDTEDRKVCPCLAMDG